MLHYGIGLAVATVIASVGLTQAGAKTDMTYTQQIEKWRQQRVERLTKPDG